MRDEDRDTLHEISRSLAVLFEAAGFSKDQILDAVATALDELPEPSPPGVSSDEKHEPLISAGLVEIAAHILGAWSSLPDSTTERGDCAPLPVLGDAFTIRSIWQHLENTKPTLPLDVGFETVLDFMLDQQSIKALDDGTYIPTKNAMLFGKDHHKKAKHILSYVRDFCATSERNLGDSSVRCFQRVAGCLQFPGDRLPQLRAKLEDEGIELLRSVDSFFDSAVPNTGGSTASSKRVSVGVYLRNEE